MRFAAATSVSSASAPGPPHDFLRWHGPVRGHRRGGRLGGAEHPPEEVCEFAPRFVPGVGLGSLPWVAPRPPGPVRVGKLYWPWGAQRPAVGHYLTTTDDLTTIREAVYPTTTTVVTGDLVLDDGTASVTAPLWMLPPRPLGQVGSDNGLWLLTLVDDRFWWWTKAATVAAQSTWAALYEEIEDALGVTITVDTVPAAYLTPPADLAGRYAALPVLLDAVAASVGQRVVRAFDGTVTAQNPTTARTSWEASQAAYAGSVLAGGSLLL
jgi:hypothetical protein